MNEITNRENLPNHLQVLAGQLGGQFSNLTSSKFYEMTTISEFERNAVDIGYEIVPTIDQSTGRGFLVGFGVSEPEKVTTLVTYMALQIYFVECSDKEVDEWTKKIQEHRLDQQIDMIERRERAQERQKKNNPLEVLGGSDD